MKINPDGSIDITDPDEIRMYLEHTQPKPVAPVEIPLAQVLANARLGAPVQQPLATPGPETREWLRDGAVMPEAAEEPQRSAVAVLEKPETEKIVMPVDKPMPKQVATPPLAYVTQAQSLVIEMMRHYPLGLSTKEIAQKLRWDGPKASRITTYMVRNESGALHPYIERIKGHKRYRLTEYGKRCKYVVVGNPSTYREFR